MTLRSRLPLTQIRRSAVAVAALALIGTSLYVATSASGEGADVTIRPTKLDRGADVRLPHLEGKTLVDGDVRIPLQGSRPVLAGKVPNGYVVQFRPGSGDRFVTERVTDGAGTTRLFTGIGPGELVVSESDLIATAPFQSRRRTLVDARSATTGDRVASRRFRGVVDVLDVGAGKVVLGGDRIGTVIWRVSTDTTRRISQQKGYLADLGAKRLSTFTDDPFFGGCTRVTPLGKPAKTLWKSCAERVTDFSPDGRRIATVGILSDGLGPNVVFAREVDGDRLARYRVGYFFGTLRWESDRDLLLDAYGRKKGATVRCETGVCERAGRLMTTPVT